MSKIRTIKEKILIQEYIHIDNGGTTFELVVYDTDGPGPHAVSVNISDGYYGYSESKISLFDITHKPNNLRKISEFFLKAALALEEKHKSDAERY